ncbi:MAG: TMEM43 family protein [Gemmataceae bacterium]|nr:TMEM43 family protein [Gemmataceae bacterium]
MSDGGFTEVTSKGWFQRLGEAIVGVLIGILLFVISFPLLFWNEGRAVHTVQGLAEGEKSIVILPDDKVNPANDGKLVHVTGLATTTETLSDAQFDVAEKAIRLERVVQMYQYKQEEKKESRKKLGGGEETVTTYTYPKVWSSETINSANFKDSQFQNLNPASMKFSSKTESAQKVTLGGFTLPAGLVGKIDKTDKVPLTTASLDKLPSDMKAQLKVSDSMYYVGKDPTNPAIGDLKIEFKVVKPTTVSVVAKQVKDSFEPYRTKADTTLNMLSVGTVSADQMFEQAKAANTFMTWILRLVGFILMAIGIALVFRPLVVMADVLPFLGDMLGMGVAFFACVIALPLSLFTIALGWVFYRPLVGIPLLLASVGILVGGIMLARGRRKSFSDAKSK